MAHVLRKDPSLSAAETQRTNAICAGLDAELAMLSTDNAILRTDLNTVHDGLALTHDKLTSADDKVFHLRDEVDDLWDDMDHIIHGLQDQVDDLKHQLRDLERGQSTRHRKVLCFGSSTPPPDRPHQPYCPTSPVLEAGEVPSATPLPRLLSCLTSLPAADSSPFSPLSIVEMPLASSIARLLPVAGGLASCMSNIVYKVESFSPTVSTFAAPWARNLGFCALLPILYYKARNLLAAVPRSVILDTQGNINFKAHPHFVLASRGIYDGQPIWHMTLMPRVRFITPDAIYARVAHLPIPLLSITLGGSNGVLISQDNPPTKDAMYHLLQTAKHHCKAAAYIERVQWTPPKLRGAVHQKALNCWPLILMSRHGTKVPLPSEPLPWDDDNAWWRWLKEHRDHPGFKGEYRYIGVPLVNRGYLTAHLVGLKALLSFLPLSVYGTVTSGDACTFFFWSTVALLIVPERYSQILSCLGEVIALLHIDQPYDVTCFGQLCDLDMEAVVCLFAMYGMTTDKAKSWRAWACAFTEMDLLAYPASEHM